MDQFYNVCRSHCSMTSFRRSAVQPDGSRRSRLSRNRLRIPLCAASVAAFLWQWGVTDAPEVWKVELVRYDQE